MKAQAGKILLIDRDPGARSHYGTCLRQQGFAVHPVGTGRGALRALARGRRPAAVVLDIDLPDGDGIELLGKILAWDERIPVVIHSADWGSRGHFGCWGARAFLAKSADSTALARCVEEALTEAVSETENVG